MAPDSAARQVYAIDLVGTELAGNAVALNEVVLNTSRVLGPAIVLTRLRPAAAASHLAPVIGFEAPLDVMDDEFAISYEGVALGVPVLTRDGKQFGILEHVLAVEEQDIFEGIVVWVGGGIWADRMVQRELSRNHQSAARFIETFCHNKLRFVAADKVAAITVGYIRCDLDLAEAGQLQPPSGAPVYYANAIDQAGPGQQVYTGRYGNQMYGRMFGRARWRQE